MNALGNFRLSVESVVCRGNNVLLVKRAPDCRVAPSVWNVPAGKVNILETSKDAVIRETFEETGLKVRIVKLLAENAFEVKVSGEVAYRNMFTYLTEPEDNSEVTLNTEHTEFAWITKKELEESELYPSLMPRLREIILQGMIKDVN